MMLSDEDRIMAHKTLVSIYMKGKLEGQDMSKHEQSFNDSIEFLKQNCIKVGPNEIEEFMKKSMLAWSRHGDVSYSRHEYHHNH